MTDGWSGPNDLSAKLKPGGEGIGKQLEDYQARSKPAEKPVPKATSTPAPPTESSLAPKRRFYGHADDVEAFTTAGEAWWLVTFDCIEEIHFWKTLTANAALYSILENRHNVATAAERDNRRALHEKIFEGKYKAAKPGAQHRAIHFFLREAPKLAETHAWYLIEVDKDGEALQGLDKILADKSPSFQAWAPHLTDGAVREIRAEIVESPPFEGIVVPYLLEIFSLHHIPDADIRGGGPTPIEPVAPLIILSEGFELDDDLGLWPDGEFSGGKEPLDERKLSPLRPGAPTDPPVAYIRSLDRWFEVWVPPTDSKEYESQLYLMDPEEKTWGYRIKLEKGELFLSEAYVEGSLATGAKTTSVSVHDTVVHSGSPQKPSSKEAPPDTPQPPLQSSTSDKVESKKEIKQGTTDSGPTQPRAKKAALSPQRKATKTFAKDRKPLAPLDENTIRNRKILSGNGTGE
ncbi:MAG: hypothetical protein K8H88_33635 [Sandaracinaceae bacterium]|nr:hypothetical protein [Sandaracinaceae bacterium]